MHSCFTIELPRAFAAGEKAVTADVMPTAHKDAELDKENFDRPGSRHTRDEGQQLKRRIEPNGFDSCTRSRCHDDG